MICNIRYFLALSAILVITAPRAHAQTLNVACTDPAGPNSPGGYLSSCIASGGTAPYTWAIVNGQLPPSLSAQVTFPPGEGSVTISGTASLGPYAAEWGPLRISLAARTVSLRPDFAV